MTPPGCSDAAAIAGSTWLARAPRRAHVTTWLSARARAGLWSALVVCALIGTAACEPPTADPPMTSSPTSSPGLPSPSPTVTTSADPLPAGRSDHALLVDDRIRIYRVYRPATLTEPAPLVVVLADSLTTLAPTDSDFGWNALAEREGFVVMYPQPIEGGWNVGDDCCGSAPALEIDDVDYVGAAVDDLGRLVSLNDERRYATGLGTGGMMAYRLACDTTIFAAIGPVGATQLGSCPNPAPVSVIHVHGSDDELVPVDGVSDLSVISVLGPPVADVLQTWRQIDRCGGKIERTVGPVTWTETPCPNGRSVVLGLVDGAGHEWPHREPQTPEPWDESTPTTSPRPGLPTPSVSSPQPRERPGPSSPGFDTTTELWEFFTRLGHGNPMPTATATPDPASAQEGDLASQEGDLASIAPAGSPSDRPPR
ncbi:MAG: hypothetical protein CSA84_00570 [Actinomycetales bacterium]|nr:MAG: hypothetical protein CSA84_00570 [Actinomycetales bacterium]